MADALAWPERTAGVVPVTRRAPPLSERASTRCVRGSDKLSKNLEHLICTATSVGLN
jgi:hypothetical protein